MNPCGNCGKELNRKPKYNISREYKAFVEKDFCSIICCKKFIKKLEKELSTE